jgi:DnaK suppressor protein
MTPELLDSFRQTLMEERARIVKNAKESFAASLNRSYETGRDSIDESTEEQLLSTELRLRDREKFLLSKINGALERIDRGEYGSCQECGEEIGIRRLKLRPVTTLCVDCKEEQEREESSQTKSPGGAGAMGDMEGGDMGGMDDN